MLFRSRAGVLITAVLLAPAVTGAQTPASPPQVPPSLGRPVATDDAMLLAQGWMLLAQGSAVPAVERAREVLAKSPSSPGAVTLAIEAEIVRAGADAGLAEYERWLGARTREEPLLLRRVCQAILREAAAQRGDEVARMNALAALAGAGDAAATNTLREAMNEGDLGATSALAGTGDPAAARALLDKVKAGTLDPVRGLRTLSRTRSAEAVSLATSRLNDSRSEVVLAAIQALRDLKVRDAAPKLRPLLEDRRPFIRIAAAEALMAIGDESGIGILRELGASESADDRLKSAEALSAHPDEAWMQSVRQLTSASEPEVRLGAARLIAPYDPDLAAAILAALRQDTNPVVRAMTQDVSLRLMPWNLAQLRGMLRGGSLGDRVTVAERVLELTH